MKRPYYFMFNRIELGRLNDFAKEHEHCSIFLIRESGESGIGQNLYITCDECQKETEITDYDSW